MTHSVSNILGSGVLVALEVLVNQFTAHRHRDGKYFRRPKVARVGALWAEPVSFARTAVAYLADTDLRNSGYGYEASAQWSQGV